MRAVRAVEQDRRGVWPWVIVGLVGQPEDLVFLPLLEAALGLA